MYDLVSTSLPNGLLPGTHGFATVAMTRGTPDAVRLALESLSSYKHRHTGHDERYATENPVAWSHLVQRDGAHVLSCVRAADFDYTGRTNRLAHHWCFPRGEFPAGANAAEMIAMNVETLSATWSGEARWLEPGANPAASSARSDRKASAWIALYGAERGASLAAGFAALLRSELQGGTNRPVVFRTSQNWDVHGTNLLQLFADLIALLPQELRDRATFSTYPAALPDYVTCHLRGLQPDDPRFAALTAGRPWFDCATGEAHGALPQDAELAYVAQHGHEKLVVPRGPKPIGSRATPGASLPDSRPPQGSTISFQPVPPPGRKAATLPRNNEWLPPPRNDNTTLYYVIGGLVVTVALLAAFVLLRTGPKPPPPSPQFEEPEIVPLSSESVAASQPNVATNASPESTAIADSADTAPSMEDRRTEEVPSAPADTPSVPPPPEKWAFENAVRVDPKPLGNANDFHSGSFFYYGGDDRFVQEEATPKSAPVAGATGKSWGKLPDFSICRILYDEEDRTAYFQWESAAPAKIFANRNSVDLQRLCFGPEPAVFKTWNRLCQAWRYDLEWDLKLDNGPRMSGSFSRSAQEGILSAEDAIVVIAQSRLKEFDQKIKDCQNALTTASNALATAEQRQSGLATALSQANEFVQKMQRIDDDIKANQDNLADEEKKKKKDETKITNLNREIERLRKDRDKAIKDVAQFVKQLPQDIKSRGILTKDELQDIVTKMQPYKNEIDNEVNGKNADVNTKQQALAAAEKAKKDYEQQASGVEGLKSLTFTVRVVVDTEAEK